MLKACIFDLDGVIVDTAKYHYIAWKRLAQELGLDLTAEENEALKGVSRMETLDIILQKGTFAFSSAEKEALAEKKNKWYLEYILQMDKREILGGVIAFLEDLKANGIRIALGSASKNAQTILQQINIGHYFEAVVDGTRVTLPKPHPQTFLLGAAALGVMPSEAIVFEDSFKGLDAALAGGFTAVGIGQAAVLQKAHAVVAGLHELTYEKAMQIHANIQH